MPYIAASSIIKGSPAFEKSDLEELRWVSKGEIDKMTFVLDCKQRILDYFSLN